LGVVAVGVSEAGVLGSRVRTGAEAVGEAGARVLKERVLSA
jgi:hypothetical protein